MAALWPAAEVARDLGIRIEVDLPRQPGGVEWAWAVADSLGLNVTAEICADGLSIRFSP